MLTDTQKSELVAAVVAHREKGNSNLFRQRIAGIFGVDAYSRVASGIESAANVATDNDELFSLSEAVLAEAATIQSATLPAGEQYANDVEAGVVARHQRADAPRGSEADDTRGFKQ